MTPAPENRDREAQLERFVHRALRELPVRRAPGSLEQRVRAEIERRAALPWWRRSFAHWPFVVRAVFVATCAVLLGASISLMNYAATGSVWVMAGFDSAQFRAALAPQLAWVESALVVWHAIGNFFNIILRNIPPLWLYGGLAFIAAMYASLCGLGAATYKALCAAR